MLEGGLQHGRPDGRGEQLAATTMAGAGGDRGEPRPDGGQTHSPEPRNVVAGALAGTDWTHDDAVVALSFVSTVALLAWLLTEVGS